MQGWRMMSMAAFCGLSACGGGGSGSGDNPGSGTAYAYVPPVLNSARVYDETVVDNLGSSVDIGYSQTVTSVATDGSVTESLQSTTGASSVADGTNFAVTAETESYNDIGQELSYVYTAANGNTVSCVFSPHGDGPDSPIRVGQTWTVEYTVTCGAAAPIGYMQQGTVVDLETVTVPAGTFTALKLVSTLTWTNAQGFTRTQTITNWRDATTSRSVKQNITIVGSGVLPANGYAVSREIVLESES